MFGRGLSPVRYAVIEGESLAYRDLGGDGRAIVYLGTHGSHQDLMWDEPGYAHLLSSLAAHGRLITFDRRGSGLSTRRRVPTIESRVADLVCVLDTTGVDEAILIAAGNSSQAALVFAAAHPRRCSALVLYSPAARTALAPDYEIGSPPELVREIAEAAERVWGTGITALLYAPSLADNEEFVSWAARLERGIATPIEAREWVEMYDLTDVRDVLAHVSAPSLVLTPRRALDPIPAWSVYVADRVEGARHVELDTADQWPMGDGMTGLLTALETFLPTVPGLGPRTHTQRRLAAILFTDIVNSTEQLRSVGDRHWRTTLDSHDDIIRRTVDRNGGRVVKSTGDGALAIFDGPAAAVEAALTAQRALSRIGLVTRAAVHFGEVEIRGDDVAGISVHLASRLVDAAGPGEAYVTTTVRDLVAGSGLTFEPRGSRALKGLESELTLLAAGRDGSL